MATQTREMRYERECAFDITSKGLVPFTAQGQDYLAYANLNLSVFVTDTCNGACDFCVAQLRYLQEGTAYAKPRIEDQDEYLARLRSMLETVRQSPSVRKRVRLGNSATATTTTATTGASWRWSSPLNGRLKKRW